MKTIRMEDMNWPDIKNALEQGFTTAVVGVGSTEQHGPHLPTKTDTLIGDLIGQRVALKLGLALQAKTICVKLFKIGALVFRNTRRIHFELSGSYPYKDIFYKIFNWEPDG